METAIQLYTLRNLTEGFATTARRVADAGFDGVEFAGIDDDPDVISAALEENELAVSGAHVSLDDLEGDVNGIANTYERVECNRLVVPSYSQKAFESRDGVDEAANRLSVLADRFADQGCELHYHNHAFEFADFGDATAFDRLADRSSDNVRFEIDTGLARHAGADPATLLDRYGDRVSLVHLTDTRPGSTETYHVDLGNGVVDLEACIEAACRADVDWLIAEHGTTNTPLETLVHAGETLDHLLAS